VTINIPLLYNTPFLIEVSMSVLVGKKAPEFKAKAVQNLQFIEELSLQQFRGKQVILFFYPLDFTFVCPTELHAFQEKIYEFERRNTQVIGCSVDSCYSHYAWMSVPKEKGGIRDVTYPILSDINKTISRAYDVLCEEEGIAYRGLFLIDKAGIVRHQVVNDLPLGRSVDEALRILDALLFHEKHGEVCPANWQAGGKTMQPNQKGLEQFFAKR
jgi:peroxiredoxin 2/4